jgi:hypothetical protein
MAPKVGFICDYCGEPAEREPWRFVENRYGAFCSPRCAYAACSERRIQENEATFAERFWERVDKKGKCWEWKAGRNKQGYGTIRRRGENMRASRMAYELSRGVILTDADHVLHTCDNPPYCRPDHLYLGSKKRNARDMVERGRCPDHRGENNGRAKLSREQISEIRRLYKEGARQVDLARMFGVVQPHISRLVRGEQWK